MMIWLDVKWTRWKGCNGTFVKSSTWAFWGSEDTLQHSRLRKHGYLTQSWTDLTSWNRRFGKKNQTEKRPNLRTAWVATGNTWMLGRREHQKNQMVDGLAVDVVQGFLLSCAPSRRRGCRGLFRLSRFRFLRFLIFFRSCRTTQTHRNTCNDM